jgi:heme/copper-type cytochrome/quinol oxidase subunit 3
MLSKILIMVVMLFTSNCYSQLIKKDIQKPNRIVLKEHGWFTVSLGTTILSSSYFIHYNYDTNGVKESVRIGGLTFSTTIGIGLHIISWERKPTYNPRLRTSKFL